MKKIMSLLIALTLSLHAKEDSVGTIAVKAVMYPVFAVGAAFTIATQVAVLPIAYTASKIKEAATKSVDTEEKN